MKSYLYFSIHFLHFASILVLFSVLSGCRIARYLEKDQALIRAVNLKGIHAKMSDQASLYIQTDLSKNSRFNLALYNSFNTKNGRYKSANLKTIGEAPRILDSALVEISRSQIEKFLNTKGYFNAQVKANIQIKHKKAAITFLVDSGASFKIRNISYTVADKQVWDLYRNYIHTLTHVHEGQTFDQDSLIYDQEQVYQLLRRNGYSDYLKSYMRVAVDTNTNANQADLIISIDNPPDRDKHSVYHINESYFTIRTTDADLKKKPDTIRTSECHFVDHSHSFHSKTIKKYLFLKKNEPYDIDKYVLTSDRLYALNVFRNVRIDFKKVADSIPLLDVYYDIIPNKKMNNHIELEYQFNSGRNGFKIADTYMNRNLFGGAELFEFKVGYDIQFDATAGPDTWLQQVLSRNFVLGTSISIPTLIPFNISKLSKNGIPYTTFSSNFQFFNQKNKFSNRIFTNAMTYDWASKKYKRHSFTPFKVEYRIGSYDPAFKELLLSEGYNLLVKTNDKTFISFSSQYTFVYNAIKLRQLSNFLYFSGAIDLAGNTSSVLNKLFNFKTNSDAFKTIFGLPYEQYVKLEADFRIYQFFGGARQFIARVNPGIGIPYGNSKDLTFEKIFFAGGSSGVRAWQARTLGPGGYNRSILADEATRRNLRGLDQFGEIKFEINLEYRFKLITKFLSSQVHGAFFTDIGNVWRFKQYNETPDGDFKINRIIQQMAIGSGFGLRFDLRYFVIRVDAGVKVKDPQFANADQWVIRHFFKQGELKKRYEENHAPDTYNFIEWNFGIGMPF